jgi:cellulose synthase/poly-beta-1,6-N-acetylglucosamine synthase-like glycosyltransferase
MSSFQAVFITISSILTACFFLYGFNQYYLLFAARRYKSPRIGDAAAERPRVSIHLPIYNEKYVVRRLLAACASMAEAYGLDKVSILVLDDSDDDTTLEVSAVVGEYVSQGVQIEVLPRGSRQGFKAGALQAALDRTNEDFIAVFDADFVPPADFLVCSVPFLVQDRHLGIVQSRWAHLNRDYSPVTRAIAIGIDVHFFVEQAGRYATGLFQNFNGSGGVLRRKAMLQAGGWQSDTLAEDLDLSYRIQLKGYNVLYLRDLESPSEIPPTVPSFKKQQGRWACGSLRTAKKILPRLLADPHLGLKKRLQAFIHLTGYLIHPLMFFSFILVSLAALLSVDTFRIASPASLFQFGFGAHELRTMAPIVLQNLVWGILGLLIVLCTLSAWVSPVSVLRAQKQPVSRNIATLCVLYLLGCGVSLNNTIEAGKALFSGREWEFKRTPKYAVTSGKRDLKHMRYQVPLDLVNLLELALTCIGMTSIATAARNSNYGVLVILIPFTLAYAFVFSLSVWQTRREAPR